VSQLEAEREAMYKQMDALRRAQLESSFHISGLQEEKDAEMEEAERRLRAATARLIREKQELADVCGERDKAMAQLEELRRAKREEMARLSDLREQELEAEEIQRKAARISAKLSAQSEELSELKCERDKVLEELEKARVTRRELSLRTAQEESIQRDIEDLNSKLVRTQSQLRTEREEVSELAAEKEKLSLEIERLRRTRLEQLSESVVVEEKEREVQDLDRKMVKMGLQVCSTI
jgi:chromosome segregation ATPase